MTRQLVLLAAFRESLSLGAALLGLIAGVLVGLLLLPRPTAGLFGQNSVGELAALAGALMCAVTFVISLVLAWSASSRPC